MEEQKKTKRITGKVMKVLISKSLKTVWTVSLQEKRNMLKKFSLKNHYQRHCVQLTNNKGLSTSVEKRNFLKAIESEPWS